VTRPRLLSGFGCCIVLRARHLANDKGSGCDLCANLSELVGSPFFSV
jgi:hypothetical protein